MKKSIKYAGIAAATLLAVAPVAAPVVSSTTVQAADTDTDYTTMTNEAKDFKGQFSDKDSSDAVLAALEAMTVNNTDSTANAGNVSYFGSKNAGNIADVQDNANVQALMDSVKANISNTTLTSLNTKVYFTATDAKGKTYDGTSVGQRPANIAAAMNVDSRMPMTITVHINNDALTSLPAEYQTFSFNLNKSDDNELKSINAVYDTPVKVAKNSKTAAATLVDTNSVVLNDQDGNSAAVSNVQFNGTFYSKYSDALESAKSENFVPGAAGAADQLNDDIKGGEFKTAGTYYQTVTYTAADNSSLANFLTKYADDQTVDSDYSIYVNGKKASAGYDYVASGQSITFVRAVQVSDSEAEWTVTDNKGVVTTKSDTPYYTLVNDNGDKIANRALAKNSAWITDQKRVDQNGNTQYRVATGEWIDANNVTFSDKATTDEGAYTDEQALNGKVTLDGPSSFVYFLYNDNGEQISSRALSGDSAWFTDKKATNAAGVTVYHVATGEWVQAGNGVNYSAY